MKFPFLKFFIVNRDSLPDRWWHRLANILIYGSTILVTLLGALIIFIDSSYTKHIFTTYNFEPNYMTSPGEEVDCDFSIEYSPITKSVLCGGTPVDGSDVVTRYNKVMREIYGLKNDYCKDDIRDSSGRLTESSLQCSREKYDIIPIESRSGTGGLAASNFRLHVLLKVKSISSFLYFEFLKDLSTIIMIMVGWYIFWESIVYRAIIYVIFGSKK